MIGWSWQQRGGAIVRDGSFEFHPPDEGDHVSSVSSASFSLLAGILQVLLRVGGRRSLGLVLTAVAQTDAIFIDGRRRNMLLLLEQLLLPLLVLLLMLKLLFILLLPTKKWLMVRFELLLFDTAAAAAAAL